MLGKKFHKIKYLYFNMNTKNKKSEIALMLSEGKSVKEVAEILKTNIAYVYKLKREMKCNTIANTTEVR